MAVSAGRQRNFRGFSTSIFVYTRCVPEVTFPPLSVSMKRAQSLALRSSRLGPILPILAPGLVWSNRNSAPGSSFSSSLTGRIPKRGRARRGFMTRTSNNGPCEIPKLLVTSGSSVSGLKTMKHTTNANAMMPNVTFLDVFILLMTYECLAWLFANFHIYIDASSTQACRERKNLLPHLWIPRPPLFDC